MSYYNWGQWSSGYNARRNVNIFNDLFGENIGKKLAGILHDFLKFTDYAVIHWEKEVKEIQELLDEKDRLKKSSRQLQTLQEELERAGK